MENVDPIIKKLEDISIEIRNKRDKAPAGSEEKKYYRSLGDNLQKAIKTKNNKFNSNK